MLEENFKVRYHEIDPDHSVPVWVLQNYFQQTAAADADNFSYGWKNLLTSGVAWVLINLNFKILKSVKGIQKIKVKTWHCNSDKIYSRRDVVIYNEKDEEIAYGASSWIIMDLAKRKITRTPDAMLNQKIDPIKDIEPISLKKPLFENIQPVKISIVKTRLEDLDVNNHVNNVHFTAWAIEGVPKNIQDKFKLKEIIINFKNEVLANQTITVKTFKDKENSFWHELTREEDGKQISLAYSVWG